MDLYYSLHREISNLDLVFVIEQSGKTCKSFSGFVYLPLKFSGFPSSIKRSNITRYVDRVPDPYSGAGAWA